MIHTFFMVQGLLAAPTKWEWDYHISPHLFNFRLGGKEVNAMLKCAVVLCCCTVAARTHSKVSNEASLAVEDRCVKGTTEGLLSIGVSRTCTLALTVQ